MTAQLATRLIALAAAALLAIVVAVAVVRLADEESGEGPAPAAAEPEWQAARAAPYPFPEEADTTACGLPVGERTLGVAHPVLPCGAKVVIRFEGREVLTQVVDRGAGAPGREFDVTEPLARVIGLAGPARIEWRFAERPG